MDPGWFQENILPILRQQNKHSNIMWSRYLYSSNVNSDLSYLLRDDMVKLSKRLYDLGDDSIKKYINIIFEASISVENKMPAYDFRDILNRLGKEDRALFLKLIAWEISSKGLHFRQKIWKDKVLPWIKDYWPLADEYLLPNYNKHWISIILAITKPTAEDFKFISSMLSPRGEGYPDENIIGPTLWFDRSEDREKVSSRKEYLLLFSALLIEGAARYNHYNIKNIIKATRSIKEKFSNEFTEQDKEYYQLIKSAIRNSSQHYNLWKDSQTLF